MTTALVWVPGETCKVHLPRKPTRVMFATKNLEWIEAVMKEQVQPRTAIADEMHDWSWVRRVGFTDGDLRCSRARHEEEGGVFLFVVF